MRFKERLILFLLCVMFVGTTTMFLYQNVYTKRQAEQNKVNVYVAKQDIAEGSTISKDKIGLVLVDKSSVLPGSIIDLKKIVGKIAKVDILKYDTFSENKITVKLESGKKFLLRVKTTVPFSSTIKKGDIVRVYMDYMNEKKEWMTPLGLADKKEVINVNLKKQSNLEVIESIEILVSDTELIHYNFASEYVANKNASIIIAKYNDLTEADKTPLRMFQDLTQAEVTNMITEKEAKK